MAGWPPCPHPQNLPTLLHLLSHFFTQLGGGVGDRSLCGSSSLVLWFSTSSTDVVVNLWDRFGDLRCLRHCLQCLCSGGGILFLDLRYRYPAL